MPQDGAVSVEYVQARFRAFPNRVPIWPNRDPIGERGGIALYVLARNHNVNQIDALGLSIISESPLPHRHDSGSRQMPSRNNSEGISLEQVAIPFEPGFNWPSVTNSGDEMGDGWKPIILHDVDLAKVLGLAATPGAEESWWMSCSQFRWDLGLGFHIMDCSIRSECRCCSGKWVADVGRIGITMVSANRGAFGELLRVKGVPSYRPPSDIGREMHAKMPACSTVDYFGGIAGHVRGPTITSPQATVGGPSLTVFDKGAIFSSWKTVAPAHGFGASWVSLSFGVSIARGKRVPCIP